MKLEGARSLHVHSRLGSNNTNQNRNKMSNDNLKYFDNIDVFNVDVYITIQTYMHACIHTYMHACIHTYLHAYIHTYIHTYVLT